MKTQFKHPINNVLLLFMMVATVFLLGFGCAMSKPVPDPLAGWHFCFDSDPKKLDKAIQDDYQDYIQKLPPKEKGSASYEHDFEDGTGRHAVRIITAVNGTDWAHVLIYDKNNKRIKVVKYATGRYAS